MTEPTLWAVTGLSVLLAALFALSGWADRRHAARLRRWKRDAAARAIATERGNVQAWYKARLKWNDVDGGSHERSTQ